MQGRWQGTSTPTGSGCGVRCCTNRPCLLVCAVSPAGGPATSRLVDPDQILAAAAASLQTAVGPRAALSGTSPAAASLGYPCTMSRRPSRGRRDRESHTEPHTSTRNADRDPGFETGRP